MGIKVLHKYHCKVTFLIKDGVYSSIPSSFATTKIVETIKKHKDRYIEETLTGRENAEFIKAHKLLFDSSFNDYLANTGISKESHKSHIIYFSKLEEILFNELNNASQTDNSLTNFQVENTKDWEFENTVSTILSIATIFEKNLDVKTQQESNQDLNRVFQKSNQDVTYLIEWKNPLLYKFLLIKNESPKLIFRLSDIKTINIANTEYERNSINFILKSGKLPFSFTPGLRLPR
jgi:hypothetical protein